MSTRLEQIKARLSRSIYGCDSCDTWLDLSGVREDIEWLVAELETAQAEVSKYKTGWIEDGTRRWEKRGEEYHLIETHEHCKDRGCGR